MSNTDCCYYIEEIPVDSDDSNTDVAADSKLSSHEKVKDTDDREISDLEKKLNFAEIKCSDLKEQIDNVKSSSSRRRLRKSKKPKRSLSNIESHINTKAHVNKIITSITNTGITPNISRSTLKTPSKHSKQKHILKPAHFKHDKKIKAYRIASDTCVQSGHSIYSHVQKIPATNNLQRKLYKTSKCIYMNDSKSKKVRITGIKPTRSCRVSDDEIPRGGKRIALENRHAITGNLDDFLDSNADLVELYHNNTVGVSISDSSFTNVKIIAKRKNFPRNGAVNKSTASSQKGVSMPYSQQASYVEPQYIQHTGGKIAAREFFPNDQQQQCLGVVNQNQTQIQSTSEYTKDQMQMQGILKRNIQQKSTKTPFDFHQEAMSQTLKYIQQQQQQQQQQQLQQQVQNTRTHQNPPVVQPKNYLKTGAIPITNSKFVPSYYAGSNAKTVTYSTLSPPMYNLTPINEKSVSSCPTKSCVTTSHVGSRIGGRYHYQLPTISSRLKQVTRNYLRQINVKTIPFVAAKSTTPSHNLGLNIQQILSIMKTKQPASGISSTLAHNMGFLPKSNVSSFSSGTGQTISAIISRLNTRHSPGRKPVGGTVSACPLLREATAYAESELADVPEHPCETDTEPLISPRIGTTLPLQTPKIEAVTDFNRRIATEWDQANPATTCKQPKCTCMPPKCVTPNTVFNKYIGSQTYSSQTRSVSDKPIINTQELPRSPRSYKFKSAFSMQSTGPTQYTNSSYKIPPAENQQNPELLEYSPKKEQQDINKSSHNIIHSQLAGKIRGLKDVLANLHNDFQKLNDRYETLSSHVQQNDIDDPEAVKKLEEMEKELNAKEEEISVVISLYKEVLSLQEQVRTLKEKTSMLSMSMQSATSYKSRIPYESSVTVRLTKLLRQIQHFQNLAKRPTVVN